LILMGKRGFRVGAGRRYYSLYYPLDVLSEGWSG
jgi:hypothetical protein